MALVDRGVFGLANIELPKKVKYKLRRKNRDSAGAAASNEWLEPVSDEDFLKVQA